ncbi:hypothetical protein DPMN_163109 [Dreissena polymorpha]|uniref:Uncharacterized protein n=1 Tax=Dreissena polymorpha TaxID=45954 RepID=A0A9D4ESN8_DREPO|nr:hypothetical protein DPMN_163109 [Dreissena polymorpha]
MEMARPRLQNATRLATQGGTEMDSTGEKNTWTTEKDVAPNLVRELNRGLTLQTAPTIAADRPKCRSLAVTSSIRRRRED